MTVLTATEALIDWFSTNEGFSISFTPKLRDDFSLLFKNIPDDNKNKSAVLLALEALKDTGVIKLNKVGDQSCYILCRPLSSLNQNVSLDFFICAHISRILNGFSENSGYSSDPQNITAEDIQHLLNFFTAMLQSQQSSVKPSEGGESEQYFNN